MGRPQIIDFEPEHILRLDWERPEMAAMPHVGDLVSYANKLKSGGPCYTVVDGDGRIMGCIGVGQLYPWGVWEVWTLLGSGFDHYPVTLHKVATRGVKWILEELKPQRLQVMCPADSERALRWLLRLGFSIEGRKTAWNPDGSDAIMLTIIHGERKCRS